VATAGVKLAERIFGKLRGHTSLILGAGTMGEQVVEQMRIRGIARVLVANRSRARGEELAQRMGAECVAWENLQHALEWPNIVVSSVGSDERVLTRAMVEQAMAARSNRALFLIDLGVPRNVEAEAGELYNVYLYNLDNLAEIVEQNKSARAGEVPHAEAIVNEHVEKFQSWQASLEATWLLGSLREKLHNERAAFLAERLAAMSHLSAEDRERFGRITEELLDRLVLDPAERVRSDRELRHKLQTLEALRDLFRLPREKP